MSPPPTRNPGAWERGAGYESGGSTARVPIGRVIESK